ncbi:MAG TPA: DMT family transporter [Feifaniaceae bacterium]|nr:DMT family transporter [Feifaniaceae bacterium]
MYILLGILAGGTIVVARMCNAGLSERIGNYKSTFYNYVTGLLGSALLLFVMGGARPSGIAQPFTIAMYLGGMIGVLNMLVSNYITPRMSAYVLTLLIFISQLASGIVLDALMGYGVSIGKVAGGVLVLLGLLYNQNVDKKAKRAAIAEPEGVNAEQN